MQKFMAVIMGSIAVGWFLSGPPPAFGQLHNPPLGWTFKFGGAQPIDGNTPAATSNGLINAPVRTPLGSTAGYFLRIEARENEGAMGIVTLSQQARTVAIPLERLRFNPAGREVLTDMSWMQVSTMSSSNMARPEAYARLTGKLTR
jgi:hypothetical protein